MAYTATVIPIMIASPGDVLNESQLAHMRQLKSGSPGTANAKRDHDAKGSPGEGRDLSLDPDDGFTVGFSSIVVPSSPSAIRAASAV
ncbi:hypothetical protein [Bradyrhizobium nanningense]|uniref:hypothetical protein n=1 Tax=Bradyrhizobium nanningense TaxID=1325118 RepID=UPI001009263C|nr:hypothetical protein [Bradyrhizobium nanningense]